MKHALLPFAAFIWLFLPTLFLATACKQTAENAQETLAEKAIENQSGENADVDIEKDKISIETDQGKTSIAQSDKKWPEKAPRDVPPFEYGQIKSSITTETPEAKSWTVIYENIAEDAIDKYDKDLKKAGFTTMKMKVNDKGGTITGEKIKGSTKTVVTVMIGEEQEGAVSLSVYEE